MVRVTKKSSTLKQPPPPPRTKWHRLLGLVLEDYFTGTQYTVETEKDVARKRQVLDIVIIRGVGKPPVDICDGFEDLREHNLLTYKAGQDSLNSEAMGELLAHSINYRKSFAPEKPISDFGLYAVSTMHPQWLLKEAHKDRVELLKPGVYLLEFLDYKFTIIVLQEIVEEPRNATWNMFNFRADSFNRAAQSYSWRQSDHVFVLSEIHEHYTGLGIDMSYTYADLRREVAFEVIRGLPASEVLSHYKPDERLQGLLPDQVLGHYKPDEVLSHYKPDEVLSHYKPDEVLSHYKPDERLHGLPTDEVLSHYNEEEILAYLTKLRQSKH